MCGTRASTPSPSGPDRRLHLVDQFAGVSAVDITDERRMDVVAEEFLETLRQSGGGRRGDDEDVVLDRAQPRHGVVQHDTETIGVAQIGTPAVPDTAGIDK